MEKQFVFNGRQVVINEPGPRDEATLSIDGTSIPLVWREEFAGWAVPHSIYGYFPDLELLARHMIISNPRLRMGHGDHPDTGDDHEPSDHDPHH